VDLRLPCDGQITEKQRRRTEEWWGDRCRRNLSCGVVAWERREWDKDDFHEMVARGYTIYISRFVQGDIIDDYAVGLVDLEASQHGYFYGRLPDMASLFDTIRSEARSWASAGAIGIRALIPTRGRLYIFWGPWAKSTKGPLKTNIYVSITRYINRYVASVTHKNLRVKI
jgi:hypothetical protein